jgi:excisionase family DNA binding protein
VIFGVGFPRFGCSKVILPQKVLKRKYFLRKISFFLYFSWYPLNMNTDDLLTAEQAAALLGIAPGTVRAVMTKGRIPVVKIYGRRLLRKEDVEAYKERSQPEGKPVTGRPKKLTSGGNP